MLLGKTMYARIIAPRNVQLAAQRYAEVERSLRTGLDLAQKPTRRVSRANELTLLIKIVNLITQKFGIDNEDFALRVSRLSLTRAKDEFRSFFLKNADKIIKESDNKDALTRIKQQLNERINVGMLQRYRNPLHANYLETILSTLQASIIAVPVQNPLPPDTPTTATTASPRTITPSPQASLDSLRSLVEKLRKTGFSPEEIKTVVSPEILQQLESLEPRTLLPEFMEEGLQQDINDLFYKIVADGPLPKAEVERRLDRKIQSQDPVTAIEIMPYIDIEEQESPFGVPFKKDAKEFVRSLPQDVDLEHLKGVMEYNYKFDVDFTDLNDLLQKIPEPMVIGQEFTEPERYQRFLDRADYDQYLIGEGLDPKEFDRNPLGLFHFLKEQGTDVGVAEKFFKEKFDMVFTIVNWENEGLEEDGFFSLLRRMPEDERLVLFMNNMKDVVYNFDDLDSLNLSKYKPDVPMDKLQFMADVNEIRRGKRQRVEREDLFGFENFLQSMDLEPSDYRQNPIGLYEVLKNKNADKDKTNDIFMEEYGLELKSNEWSEEDILDAVLEKDEDYRINTFLKAMTGTMDPEDFQEALTKLRLQRFIPTTSMNREQFEEHVANVLPAMSPATTPPTTPITPPTIETIMTPKSSPMVEKINTLKVKLDADDVDKLEKGSNVEKLATLQEILARKPNQEYKAPILNDILQTAGLNVRVTKNVKADEFLENLEGDEAQTLIAAVTQFSPGADFNQAILDEFQLIMEGKMPEKSATGLSELRYPTNPNTRNTHRRFIHHLKQHGVLNDDNIKERGKKLGYYYIKRTSLEPEEYINLLPDSEILLEFLKKETNGVMKFKGAKKNSLGKQAITTRFKQFLKSKEVDMDNYDFDPARILGFYVD